MPLIEALQTVAAITPAREAMALLFLIATSGTALWAFFRSPEGFRRHRLALAAATAGAVLLLLAPRGWLPVPLIAAMAFLVVAGFARHALDHRFTPEIRPMNESTSKRAAVVWSSLATALAATILLADLAGYSGSLMVWEPESMSGLVGASRDEVSWSRFALSRLLWGQGLVSTGHDSLLFGSGTYGLWHLLGVSRTSLRLMAVLLAAACLPAVYWASRSFAGRKIATAAVVVMATSPVLLYYGRYGVSLSGTFFAALLLLGVFLRLVRRTRDGWRWGLAAGGVAFLATLGYATGRVATLGVVSTTLLFAAASWRRLTRKQWQAFSVMVVALCTVWIIQTAFDRPREFVAVNREHILTAEPQMEWVKELLGNGADVSELDMNQRLEMTAKVMASALQDLSKVLAIPFQASTSSWEALHGDPPEIPLAHPMVLLLALWGLTCSLVMWRGRWPVLLFAFFASTSVPLLFTNRVDMHRLSLSFLPVVVWAAIGLLAAAHVMRECGVPKAVGHLSAALLVLFVAADNSSFLFEPEPPIESPLVEAVMHEVDAIEDPVAVGSALNYRVEAEIELALLDREMRDPQDPEHRDDLLWLGSFRDLSDFEGTEPAPEIIVESTLHEATVLLVPLDEFKDCIDVLRARGMSAQPVGDEPYRLWELDSLPPGEFQIADGAAPADDHNSRARRSRAARRPGFRASVPLIATDIREAFYGSKAPRLVGGHGEESIVIAGTACSSAIRMSSWTHLDIDVPFDATAFESLIGFSDESAACDHPRASFEVWGDDHRRLFDSGPLSPGDGPRHVIVPLDSTSIITLVVTEAGNGPECDEVLWAEPVFRLAP